MCVMAKRLASLHGLANAVGYEFSEKPPHVGAPFLLRETFHGLNLDPQVGHNFPSDNSVLRQVATRVFRPAGRQFRLHGP